ncbi:MAG TPA: glycosyltransferase family 4 protein [Tepidisphaeraceae bacterium]|nr:glycosyltransferase family 4 protein [Tepidisphaeraceae bacterium]
MRIIVAHNFYQQPGGEDQVFAAEADLLRRHGEEVHTFTLHNDAIEQMGRIQTFAATLWNRESYRSLRQLVRDTQAQVVHFHNTFPLISPAAYAAARDAGAAVVQTIHNFRLICPSALLLRNDKPCEECVGRTFALPGVIHACYRGSRMASATVATMTAVHRLLGTWHKAIDAYIALTPFARGKLIEGGLPADKIHVEPNFVDPDPGVGSGSGGYALFVGRLSNEKGVQVLLDAWKQLGNDIPLKIIGDGSLVPLVREAASRCPAIEWLGRKPLDEVYEWIGNAAFLISPSQCYESCPRVISEAFSKGTPVLATGHGAGADLVRPCETGLLFEPGNAASLAQRVRELAESHKRMRLAARAQFELRYTGARHYEKLMEIYQVALARRGASVESSAAACAALTEVGSG